jgi:hypothetical protein
MVAQHEVETTPGWLHPLNFQNLQKLQKCGMDADVAGQGALSLNDWQDQIPFTVRPGKVAGTGYLYEGAF